MIDPSARIHATADLEADVSVGPGTTVWHHAQIRRGARIGRDGVIGRDVFIDESVTLGDRVKVQNGALIYHGVTIEDGVFIGPGAILTNDRRPRSVNADGGLARAADWTVSPIRIAVGASVGAGAVVVAGRDVGPYAMVGAGAVVTHDVPAHALVVGNPARQIGWVCVCGERLVEEAEGPGSTGFRCPACGRGYDRGETDGSPVARERQVDAPGADGMIPIARPDIGPEEIAAVTEVLQSGMLAGGRRVAELEDRFATFIGVKHAIAVSNGTVALMCLFEGLGLDPGDEVITVGHTFNATVSSILSTGATPVFVDIEPDTYLIDAGRIEAAITPRTRAICPVHLFGLPAEMDAIVAIAERHGLAVVEDACQAHGADLPRPSRRELRARRVQPVRHQEHDDRRGRPDHDRRRPARRLDPAVPESRGCASDTATRSWATTSA